MLSSGSLKAVYLLHKGNVVLEKTTDNFFYFKVNDTEVTFDLRKKYWSCTCIHEGWRGAKVEKRCYHIKGCQYYLKEKKLTNGKKKEK